MKKIAIILFLILMMITACKNGSDIAVKHQNTTESVAGSNHSEAPKPKQISEKEQLITAEVNEEKKQLILKDLYSKQVIKQISWKDDWYIASENSINILPDGKLLIVWYKNSVKGDSQSPNKLLGVKYQLYDQTYELLEEEDITNHIPKEFLDGYAFLQISPRGSTLIWHQMSHYYVYDLPKKNGKTWEDMEVIGDLVTDFVYLNEEEVLYYTARDEETKQAEYGTLNLQTGKVTHRCKLSYNINTIRVAAPYICLNDYQDYYKGSSGSVYVCNLTTGKQQEFQVDGEESVRSWVTEDGKNLIAVAETRENHTYRVRQYDISTKKVKQEIILKEKDSDLIKICSLSNNRYGLIFHTDKAGDVLSTINLK